MISKCEGVTIQSLSLNLQYISIPSFLIIAVFSLAKVSIIPSFFEFIKNQVWQSLTSPPLSELNAIIPFPFGLKLNPETTPILSNTIENFSQDSSDHWFSNHLSFLGMLNFSETRWPFGMQDKKSVPVDLSFLHVLSSVNPDK